MRLPVACCLVACLLAACAPARTETAAATYRAIINIDNRCFIINEKGHKHTDHEEEDCEEHELTEIDCEEVADGSRI
jgi:hypothetical protein